MKPAEFNLLHVVHVASVVVMIAYTFFACAAAPETRKKVMMVTGIASLLALLTGIRMWQGAFSFTMAGWIWIKVVCWLGLSALTGVAYRKRASAGTFMAVALVLAVLALIMVYYKPF